MTSSVDCDAFEETPTCPLCMEELDETDKDFFPCPCDYQVCLWCLEYIKTNLGGKCPACRQQYDESKYRYLQTKPAELLRREAKSGPKQATKDFRQNASSEKSDYHINCPIASRATGTNTSSNLSNLKDIRVIQRNLCYVLGLPPSVARKEDLVRPEFFGRYGIINNIVVTRTQSNASAASYSAYVTFNSTQEAVDAIKDIDGTAYEGRVLRSSFGTTKYCSFFLRGVQCVKPDCFYLHHLGDESDSFTREEMIASRNAFTEIPKSGTNEPIKSIYRIQLRSFEAENSSHKLESQFGKPVSTEILQQLKEKENEKKELSSDPTEDDSSHKQRTSGRKEWGAATQILSNDRRKGSLESRKTFSASMTLSKVSRNQTKLSPTSQNKVVISSLSTNGPRSSEPSESTSASVNPGEFPEIGTQLPTSKREARTKCNGVGKNTNVWQRNKPSHILFQKISTHKENDSHAEGNHQKDSCQNALKSPKTEERSRRKTEEPSRSHRSSDIFPALPSDHSVAESRIRYSGRQERSTSPSDRSEQLKCSGRTDPVHISSISEEPPSTEPQPSEIETPNDFKRSKETNIFSLSESSERPICKGTSNAVIQVEKKHVREAMPLHQQDGSSERKSREETNNFQSAITCPPPSTSPPNCFNNNQMISEKLASRPFYSARTSVPLEASEAAIFTESRKSMDAQICKDVIMEGKGDFYSSYSSSHQTSPKGGISLLCELPSSSHENDIRGTRELRSPYLSSVAPQQDSNTLPTLSVRGTSALDSRKDSSLGCGIPGFIHPASLLSELRNEDSFPLNSASTVHDLRDLRRSAAYHRPMELDKTLSIGLRATENPLYSPISLKPTFEVGLPTTSYLDSDFLTRSTRRDHQPLSDFGFDQLQAQAKIYEEEIQQQLQIKIEQYLLSGDVNAATRLEAERDVVATALLRAKLIALIRSVERQSGLSPPSARLPAFPHQQPPTNRTNLSDCPNPFTSDFSKPVGLPSPTRIPSAFGEIHGSQTDGSLLLRPEEASTDLTMYQGSLAGRGLHNKYKSTINPNPSTPKTDLLFNNNNRNCNVAGLDDLRLKGSNNILLSTHGADSWSTIQGNSHTPCHQSPPFQASFNPLFFPKNLQQHHVNESNWSHCSRSSGHDNTAKGSLDTNREVSDSNPVSNETRLSSKDDAGLQLLRSVLPNANITLAPTSALIPGASPVNPNLNNSNSVFPYQQLHSPPNLMSLPKSECYQALASSGAPPSGRPPCSSFEWNYNVGGSQPSQSTHLHQGNRPF